MISYRQTLDRLDEAGMLRRLRPYGRSGGALIEDGGRALLNLSSNDYLGLAGDSALLTAFYETMDMGGPALLEHFALGTASSRLLTGDTAVAHRLEAHLAGLYGRPALLFNSGYHANIGILPALLGKNDLIVSDKLNHASLHDGLRVGRAACKRFNHRDYEHLRRLLEHDRQRYQRAVIVSESIFSMDGDCADLARLVALK
ncbi:MAG: aminotransferase class I/II-fold pyridoxal phosphate-dependent enzyme, partial [Desulfofustis sp.]|nr:aminotransferase class I/II-fold pyridoxal phosphate-dependent enzyme [Desulfofustis sp.]